MDVTRTKQPTLPFGHLIRLSASDRAPLRRCVRRVRLEPDPDGTYVFRARSFTRERGRVYRCTVNPRSGRVWCGCRDFEFCKGPMQPTYWDGPLCKHLERATKTVRRAEREKTAGSRRAI